MSKTNIQTQLQLLEIDEKCRVEAKRILKKYKIDLDKNEEVRMALYRWLNTRFSLRLVQGR